MSHDRTAEVALEGQQQVFRATFPGIRDSVRELLGVRADALARKFDETHDVAVKDELLRLLKEYGKLTGHVGICGELKHQETAKGDPTPEWVPDLSKVNSTQFGVSPRLKAPSEMLP